MNNETILLLLIPIILWDLIWRGIALWKSAQSKQRNWFIALLIINSIGILPILYLGLFWKKPRSSKPISKTSKKRK